MPEFVVLLKQALSFGTVFATYKIMNAQNKKASGFQNKKRLVNKETNTMKKEVTFGFIDLSECMETLDFELAVKIPAFSWEFEGTMEEILEQAKAVAEIERLSFWFE